MPEQLELFGSDFASPEEEANAPAVDESKAAGASPKSKPENRAKAQPEKKQDYVTVKVGYEEGLTSRAKKMLSDLGLNKPAEQVLVVWNKRMRTAAGRAFYKEYKIELNPRLQVLEEPKRSEEIDRTFLHELGHLVAYARNTKRRIQPHGVEWQQACADLGIPGENRCHDLGFKSRQIKRKFGYQCPSCDNVIQRVQRMKRRVACYDCCQNYNRGNFDTRFVLVEHHLT